MLDFKVEGAMDLPDDNHTSLHKHIENILAQDVPAEHKLRFLVALGLDEEEAELLVERHQSGNKEPVYYEELTLYSGEDDSFLHS